MEDKTKGYDQIILLIIIGGLIGWNIFTTNSIKTDVNGYEKKIESLQTKIDSAKIVNKEIGNNVSDVKENVKTITTEIHKIDKNITIVKNKTNEKVNSVDNIPDNELEQFFTNKYEQPTPNSGK
jgi:seryl-tRNA synthetase